MRSSCLTMIRKWVAPKAPHLMTYLHQRLPTSKAGRPERIIGRVTGGAEYRVEEGWNPAI